MSVSVRLFRQTATWWSTNNPVLADGRPGYDTTNDILKIGDGTSTWSALPAVGGGGGGGGVTDGDKGDITVSGSGATWTIDNGAVTLAKQADMATASVVYRKTAGSGAPEVQSLATLKADLGLTGTNSGDQTITLTGDVTGSGTGSFAATIANDTVTNAKAANMATARIKGRVTSGTGDPEDLTGTQATTLLDTFTSSLKGLAPASGGGTTNFLRADGTWAAPAGGVLNNLTATSAPTVNDDTADGYAVGSRWLWAARGLEWVCVDATAGAARWALVRQDFTDPSRVAGPLIDYKLRHFGSHSLIGGTQSPDEVLTIFTEAGSSFSATTYTTGQDGQIGILACRTAATATLQRPTLGANSVRPLNVAGSPIRRVIAARLRIRPAAAPNAPSATNDYQLSFGFQPANSDREPADYVRLDYRWTGSAVEYAARRRVSSGTVQSVALTAPTADTWFVAAVAVSDGLVEYYLDGVLVASATTTIPTASLREILLINQTTAANANGYDCDWLATMTIGHPG